MDRYGYALALQKVRRAYGKFIPTLAFMLLRAAHPRRSDEEPPMIIYKHVNGEMYRWRFTTWREFSGCKALVANWFAISSLHDFDHVPMVHPETPNPQLAPSAR